MVEGMFRLLRFTIFLLIVIVTVIATYLWIARVPTLERFLTHKLGYKVTLEEVNVGWNQLTIEKLRMENPQGSSKLYAFEAETIFVEYSPLDLWKKTLHLPLVKIERPTLTVELYNSSGTENNWSRILNTIPTKRNRHFVIDKLSIIHLRFEVIRANGKTLSIPPLPYLEFENLGTNKPLTLGEIGKIVFQSLLKSLTSKPHLRSLLDNVPKLSRELLPFLYPVEKEKGGFRKSLDKIRRRSQEATDFLQDIFS